jgi:hypothetical protein
LGPSHRRPSLLPRRRLWILVAAMSEIAIVPSPSAAPNAPGGPALSARPAVTGTPTQGARLHTSPGVWTGSGRIHLAYQWYRCDTMGARCTLLRGATRRGRILGDNDVGHTIGLQVRASDPKGSTTAYASLVGPVAGAPPLLSSTKQPAISGDAVPGSTVHVDPGLWRPKPASFSYQWVRCDVRAWACTPIKGAITAQYVVDAKDLGHSLVAIVQAKAGAISRAIFSVATAPALAGGESVGPANSAPPSVAQLLQEGSQLTGNIGSWSSSGGIRYAYQWYRCDTAGADCSTIHGATRLTYTPVSRDVGHTLGLSVRATDVVGTTAAYAGLVGPVAAPASPIVSSGQPTIAGMPTQGQTLQVSPGAWSQTPTAVSYQWERCNENGRLCAPIAGATTPTYVTTADDLGHALLVIVHATLGDAGQDALSGTTRPISPAAGPSSSVPPTVSGTAQAGKQLTGATGTWSGSGTIAYAFQWYRCDASGARCSSIHGATKPNYTEVAKDVGQTLAFAVRASDSAGTTTKYTGVVGPVAAASYALAATTQPQITGTPQHGQTLQAGNGVWTETPSAASYQWLRCNANGRLCTAIPGATAITYAATADDAGHGLVVLVQATANGVTQGALSSPTPPIP